MGFEGIEVFSTTSRCINSRHCSQPYAFNAPGVIVDPSDVGLLCPIDPEGQATVVSSYCSGSAPVQLDGMRCIADGEPTAAGESCSIVQDQRSDLILASRVAELELQHCCSRNCSIGGASEQNHMAVVLTHSDRIRIEIEARSITCLSSRKIISDIDEIIVID